MRFFSPFIVVLLVLAACTNTPPEKVWFTVKDAAQTGLHFTNKLTPTPAFNMFTYMYFYNGAGVGAGDFNNDGQIDLFFSSNQGKNELYLNKGKLQFENITEKIALPQDSGWSTGVSVADVNGDNLLDIYICKVGDYETLRGKNQLLICQGIENGLPVYRDEAEARGIAFSGFSTQAAFFDYDLDGDLDLYLLNHAVHQNGNFAERKGFADTYHPLTGDRMFRNEQGQFVDVTRESKINSSAIGYGLGIVVSDISLDGYPDLYIGNDFHENDYIYINQRNGTFKEELTQRTMHTSQFSMGVDIADINNDALPEIISMDMQPSDPNILKRSLGDDEYNIFHMKNAYGYHPQFARNALQWNRGNGMFSEVGMYAGVHATDWSWAPLWMDFDNDGWKDLFVSNGIPRRLNDIDYVNYVSNEGLQTRIAAKTVSEREIAAVDAFPQIKLPNKFFHNKGNLLFEDAADAIEGSLPTFSNGSVYADFDNDGDLDIVVNNIDEPVLLYQNRFNDSANQAYLRLNLQGPAQNTKAIGARIVVFTGDEIRTYEKYPVKGFQSSMELPLHVGLNNTLVDSILLIWPDQTYQRLQWQKEVPEQTIRYVPGLPRFDFELLATRNVADPSTLQNITSQSGLLYRHEENPFVEFDREPLIPHMVSREGPALAVADINGDLLDDVFLGAAKGKKPAVFVQTQAGKFQKLPQPALDSDSTYEDVAAVWADVNGDRFPDLVIASGGNEFQGQDEHLLPRVYLNNGKGTLVRRKDAFQNILLTASCVVPYDFTGDGAVDLFIGARAVPWEYGQKPQSYLLANDGTGKFTDVTGRFANGLADVGFVKDAVWADLDGNGDEDLVLSMEWDGIIAFVNNSGRFTRVELTDRKGWWNFALPVDVDADGDLDLVAGNLGLNNRFNASAEQPVRLYYNDFDGNGKKEQVLTYYLNNREIPFANKAELEKQLPVFRKQFLYAADFAKATLENLLGEEKLKAAVTYSAGYFSNVVLVNEGKWKFSVRDLPWQAQQTTYRDAVVVDANNDRLPDIFLVGNFWNSNIQMGRYDGDYGTLLINKGEGHFVVTTTKGLPIHGQVRQVAPLTIGKKQAYILGRNNDSALLVQLETLR